MRSKPQRTSNNAQATIQTNTSPLPNKVGNIASPKRANTIKSNVELGATDFTLVRPFFQESDSTHRLDEDLRSPPMVIT